MERYTDIPELTPCILHEFVEKIIVHAASDPKGKNRTQEIDIYYKGIGALEMSKVTVSKSRYQWKNEKTVQPKPYRSLFPHDVFLSGAAFTRFFFYSFRSRYSAASALPFRKDGISGYSAGSVSPSRSFHTAAPAAVTRSATVCTPRTSRSSGSAA